MEIKLSTIQCSERHCGVTELSVNGLWDIIERQKEEEHNLGQLSDKRHISPQKEWTMESISEGAAFWKIKAREGGERVVLSELQNSVTGNLQQK